MYKKPGSVTIRSISSKCRIGSKISLKGVPILQRIARLVRFTLDFTEIPMKMILVSRGGGGGSSEPGGSKELHETPMEP